MHEEYNSVLPTPTEPILADTDILAKPKYRPFISARLIYRFISTINAGMAALQSHKMLLWTACGPWVASLSTLPFY